MNMLPHTIIAFLWCAGQACSSVHNRPTRVEICDTHIARAHLSHYKTIAAGEIGKISFSKDDQVDVILRKLNGLRSKYSKHKKLFKRLVDLYVRKSLPEVEIVPTMTAMVSEMERLARQKVHFFITNLERIRSPQAGDDILKAWRNVDNAAEVLWRIYQLFNVHPNFCEDKVRKDWESVHNVFTQQLCPRIL